MAFTQIALNPFIRKEPGIHCRAFCCVKKWIWNQDYGVTIHRKMTKLVLYIIVLLYDRILAL